MTPDKIIFYCGFLFMIASLFIRKDKKRARSLVILIGSLFIFVPLFFPKKIFGRWNAIKSLKDKQVVSIILKPSLPDWKVNLTDSDVMITNKSTLDTLTTLLSKTEVYFPDHPIRIWETSVFVVTAQNDTLKLKVSKTENNGTVITTPEGRFSKDGLDKYLEYISKFKEPAFAKYSHDKHSD